MIRSLIDYKRKMMRKRLKTEIGPLNQLTIKVKRTFTNNK